MPRSRSSFDTMASLSVTPYGVCVSVKVAANHIPPALSTTRRGSCCRFFYNPKVGCKKEILEDDDVDHCSSGRGISPVELDK